MICENKNFKFYKKYVDVGKRKQYISPKIVNEMGCCHLACYIKLLFQIPVTKRFTQSTPDRYSQFTTVAHWPSKQNQADTRKYDYHFIDSVILLGSSSRGRFPTSKPHVEEKLFAMAHVEGSSLPLPKHC